MKQFSAFLTLFLLFSCALEKDSSWIDKNVIPIRSIEPEDEDYSDLEPLKEKIGSSRVVMLGEQEHGDGSTYAAKSRLVKFLYQEMGFSVVAFESGFYGVNKAWDDYKAKKISYEQVLGQLYIFWSESEMCQDFFERVESSQNSESPISLAGFDNQQITRIAKRDFIPGIDSLLRAHNIDFLQGDLNWFKQTTSDLMDHFYDHKLPPKDQERFFEIIASMKQNLTDKGVSSFWIQSFDNLKGFAEHAWFFWIDKEADMADHNWWDIQMAKNFMWLYREKYKNERIIIWAANGHTVKTDTLFDVEVEGYKPEIRQYPMGEVLFDSLGQDLYSIGFTSSKGSYATLNYDVESDELQFVPEAFEPVDSLSLEYQLEQTGHQYSFLNFKNESDPWLNVDRRMRVWRPDYVRGKLPELYDGIFYIKEMKPNTKLLVSD
ncbi:MAG: erythromycin esterase family protein [Bacteroidota bacterium]